MGREFWFLTLIFVMLAGSGRAESLIAVRLIRAQEVIQPEAVGFVPEILPGAATDLALVLGMEARVAIYAGRPIRIEDIGPPAIVERNQAVSLIYQTGTLLIAIEGRALARGGVGDRIRVMNIASRSTLTGRIAADGSVRVEAGS